MSRPRVSVVIPNFDNGRGSASVGQRDFLGELLRSLERTLKDDPELLEIIVADDGSTDDSLETARAWSRKRWPDGRPFLRLVEFQHSGILSRVLNRLVREAKGKIIARLDGDTVLRTPRWASELTAIFDRDSSLGVVSGAQLRPDGSVHAFGDDLWGPRGYRHIAHGARLEDLPPERYVDHVMGCFHATRRAVHETAGKYDESILRGQTEEYGVRVRLAGWKVLATSRIVFEHWHGERSPRRNHADRAESLDASLGLFRDAWGFDRLAPDLAAVRDRYAGTPLWWRDHKARSGTAADDEWARLGQDPALAQRLAEEFDLALRAIRAADRACLVTHVGCGCGCLGHAIARAGGAYEGFEEIGGAVESARRSLQVATHPVMPRFTALEDLAKLPLTTSCRPVVCLFGVLERYWNPVGLLRECQRILGPGGTLCVRTRVRREALDDPDDPEHRFSVEEFLAFLRHVGEWAPFGFDPHVTASGWIECCLVPAVPAAGRGYFSPSVEVVVSGWAEKPRTAPRRQRAMS